MQNNYLCIYRDNISYAEMHLLSVIGAGIYVNMLQKGSQETNIINMINIIDIINIIKKNIYIIIVQVLE